jgi:hypothetical protein
MSYRPQASDEAQETQEGFEDLELEAQDADQVVAGDGTVSNIQNTKTATAASTIQKM